MQYSHVILVGNNTRIHEINLLRVASLWQQALLKHWIVWDK